MRAQILAILFVCLAGIPLGCGVSGPDAQSTSGSSNASNKEGARTASSEASRDVSLPKSNLASPAAHRESEAVDAAMPVDHGSSKAEHPDADPRSRVADAPTVSGEKLSSDGAEGRDSKSRPSEATVTSRPGTNRNNGLQAGTLTAGAIDDHENYADYYDYFSQAQQDGERYGIPRVSIGQRVPIRVVDSEGTGIGDARVLIRAAGGQNAQDGNVLVELQTGSDGRTLFLTGLDAPTAGDDFAVTVLSPDGRPAVEMKASLNQSPWTVKLPDTVAHLPTQLDLALVIDTTGSMGDELNYLKAEIDYIAEAIHRRFPNVDQRFALILYRDQGDEYVTRTFDFTSSLEEFRNHLAEQTAGGGGDYPEAMHLALKQAEELSWRNKNTARVLFLVGDAPPHDELAPAALDSIKRLRLSEITMFPVAASGVGDAAEFLMREAAFLTLGQYLFLTDHSGVGNSHAKPHTPSYTVEKLNQLMIRMIGTELAGEPMLARDILAIESGDADEANPAPIPQDQTSQQTRESVASPLSASALAMSLETDRNEWSFVLLVLFVISTICLERWCRT